MNINLTFKSLTLINGEEVTLSISHGSMKKMIMDLVANGYLTTEELIILAIGQIKLCDRNHIDHVLPENLLKKLNKTFESVMGGEKND
ncbi:hypothetical protein N4G41_03615 [Kosakonia sacchari]|uniref:hypothetical protein n=1 Tax=Kosakonia sacchari TaxID=1158459 RepID=UPI002ACD36FB|nr:hypothetical protein [Kosakonia sacchari]MDZ7320716.1 hypothetical protein [Kosakonia sacchari]